MNRIEFIRNLFVGAVIAPALAQASDAKSSQYLQMVEDPFYKQFKRVYPVMPKFRTYSQISEWREKESSDFMLVKQYAEDSIRFDEPILEKWTHLYRGIVYCSISWEGAGKVKSMAILKLDPKYVV